MCTCTLNTLNHTSVSLYFILNIIVYAAVDVDQISLVTMCLLFVILQYKFGMLRVKQTIPCSAFSRCVYCDKMTPQHYIHCKKCNECADTIYMHIDFVGICVDSRKFIKYMYIVRGMVILNIILCLLLSLRYAWSIIVVVVHIYVLKSTYLYARGDIYVQNK